MENFLRELFQQASGQTPPTPPSGNNNNGNGDSSNTPGDAASNNSVPDAPPGAVPVFLFASPDFIMASIFGPFGIPMPSDFIDSAMAASMMQQQENMGPPPTSTRVLQQLPIISVSSHDLIEPVNRECCICLTENELHSKALRLPCSHILHPDCAKQWLTKHNTCPVCRYELPTDCPHYEQGRMERMRNRKPRFARHELDRLSIRELKELLNWNKNADAVSKYHPVDKNDLIEYLIQSNVIDLIQAPPPVEYCYKDLKNMSISRLKEVMNDAGVFFSKEDVVEKDDLLRLFVMSGRLTVLSEEETPRKQQPSTESNADDDAKQTSGIRVETVNEDSDDEDGGANDERVDSNVLMEENCALQPMAMDSATAESTREQGNEDSSFQQSSAGPAGNEVADLLNAEESGTRTTKSESVLGTPSLSFTSVGDAHADTAFSAPSDAEESPQPQSDDALTRDSPLADMSTHSRKRQRRYASSSSTLPSHDDDDIDHDEFVIDDNVVVDGEDIQRANEEDGDHDSRKDDTAEAFPPPDHAESEIVRRFQALGINQLQVLARECSVDTSNCLEKIEIIDRLVASDRARSTTSFDDWGCGEMRALASLVDVDLSLSAGRQDMIHMLHEEVSRRPHAGRYLLALAPLARLTTTQLRAVARDWLVNVSDCLERGEIIHRLVNAAQNRETVGG